MVRAALTGTDKKEGPEDAGAIREARKENSVEVWAAIGMFVVATVILGSVFV
jgi:hypothetical protein